MLLPHHACVCYLKSNVFSEYAFFFNKNSVDVLYKTLDSVGIDDIFEIKQFAARNPVVNDVVTLAIECNKMTSQAQNALLKILEDPPVKTQFIFFVSSKSVFIPTVHSRLHDVTTYFTTEFTSGSLSNDDVGSGSVAEFIASGYKDRLALIDGLVKTEKIDDFIASLKLDFTQITDNVSNKFVLSFVMQNVYQPGASKKMLLEYLALQLPVVRK